MIPLFEKFWSPKHMPHMRCYCNYALALGVYQSSQTAGASPGELTDHVLQRLKVHRLDQVLGEARLPAPAEVFVLSEPAERNALDSPLRPADLTHKFQTGPVRQTNIAHQQIELFTSRRLNGLPYARGRVHGA